MTNRKITSAVSVVAGLIACLGLSAWLLPPVAPVGEFQDIMYNEIITDSTNGAMSYLDSAQYASCIGAQGNFDAGDKLYRLTVSDTADLSFELSTEADLHLFVLSNVYVDSLQSDCPDTCIDKRMGTGKIDRTLAPGIYWVAVDGEVSNQGTVVGEGSFTLAVRNVDDYELIECGEIITSTTVGRVSNYGDDGYGAFCEIDTPYVAGDRIYRFDVAVAGNYVINLEKLDGTDLRLFVHQRLEFLGQEFFVCLGASEVDGTMEVLSSNMTLGEYYIIVDGTEDNEGGFRLSIACPDDYADIACGELVMGNTATRVNYRSDYTNCGTDSAYGGGDRTYRFELANDDDVTINLTPLEGDDLDLILMTDSFTCISISDTATGTKETMQQMLTTGVYYIIVDGATVNDTSAQGPYMLEVKCASLPVELVSFRGNEIEDGILLDWETASEVGFEGFYLQKSQTAETWDNLNWQAGKGSPTTPAKYSYVDGQPYQGTNFFRLKAVDFDGTINYSGIIQVNYKKGVARPEFRAYPTLATDWITVEGYEEGRTIRYEIRTVLGQLLQSGRINGNNQNIEISGLPTGMFYLTLNDGSRYKTIPVRKN